jgi:16S rRNA (adenine1518-N6/adenine1519-N6)-dimethyltransferase
MRMPESSSILMTGKMSEHKHFHAKKRYSQHFLTDKRIAKKIAGCAGIEDAQVIEIGAGKGFLTKVISRHAAFVYAVELDRELIPLLEALRLSNVKIINDDFLQCDLAKYKKPVIIGNIPYSITTQIIEKLALHRGAFKRAVLTIQKEYAERLLAKPGTAQYGPLSLFTRYYFSVEKKFSISARYFSPKPRISSVVIELTDRKKPFALQDERSFFKMIQGIFCYRRKYIKNALVHHLHMLPQDIDSALLKKRPGDLTLYDYHTVYNRIYNR